MTDWLVDVLRALFGVENAVQGAYAALFLSLLMVVVPPLYLMVRLIPTGGMKRRPRKLKDEERLALIVARETGNPYQSPLH